MNNHYVLNGGCAIAYPPYAGCTHIIGRVDKRSATTEIHAGCTHVKGRVDKRSASTEITHSKMEVVHVSMGFQL